jgi:hypothetical protein
LGLISSSSSLSPRGPGANTNRVSPYTVCVSGSIAGKDQAKVKLRHLPRTSPGPKNSSAAERLHMAQPPLSVAIGQLDEELGTILLQLVSIAGRAVRRPA